jgi:hypothetical protein
MLSFKLPTSTIVFKTGTYGICGCADDAEKPAKIALTFSDDNTFHYVNNFDPAKKIDVTGNWVIRGNKLLLENYASDIAIHHKWKMDKTGKCIVSRKGLYFMRICEVKPC